MAKEVTLKSGNKLKITAAPFSDARALYQAVAEEALRVKLDPSQEVDVNLYKDLFCLVLSSKKIEACLDQCMKRVTYNDLKVDKDTWEPESAREDFLEACMEVATENLRPFTKNLYAQFSQALGSLKTSPA